VSSEFRTGFTASESVGAEDNIIGWHLFADLIGHQSDVVAGGDERSLD
jgi:hypothetical protein